MGEQEQDTANTGGGPLEEALQGDTDQQAQSGGARMGNQTAPSGNAGVFESGGAEGAGGLGQTGRAGFTTPGAVSSIQGMAAKSENFSDPIAGEAEAGAEMLERAKKDV